MSWISGVGLTPFGRLEKSTSLSLASAAAVEALADAELTRPEVDGVLIGYSTTAPHLMPAGAFSEHFGLRPRQALGIASGGATGLAMVALADQLVSSGQLSAVLVVAGENRLSGQTRDDAMQTLAQVGHPEYEVPLGANVPGYYALLASNYLAQHPKARDSLAELAVLARRHAGQHDGAHLRAPITVEDVHASKPIADPLRLLDCCPVSDGGAAVLVTAGPCGENAIRIRGAGQAHHHQHVTAADLRETGAAESSALALAAAGVSLPDIDVLGIYDSFTVTLAILLEEIGVVPAGSAGQAAADGQFDRGGQVRLNTDGGLLSHGHCGVGGSLAHLVEVARQLSDRAGDRQEPDASLGLVHADGGVLSAHVSVVLEAASV